MTRLTIIKTLASTIGKAHKSTLRNFCVVYVRTAMNYGLLFPIIAKLESWWILTLNIKTMLIDETVSKVTLRSTPIQMDLYSRPHMLLVLVFIYIWYSDTFSYDFSCPSANSCSNYEPELLSINAAVELIHHQFDVGEKRNIIHYHFHWFQISPQGHQQTIQKQSEREHKYCLIYNT